MTASDTIPIPAEEQENAVDLADDVTIRDVFQPEQAYTMQALSSWAGIPMARLLAALRAGELARHKAHLGEHASATGQEVISWVERANIAVKLDPGVVARIRTRREAEREERAAEEAAKAAPRDLAGEAEQALARERNAEIEHIARAWRQYAGLLARYDTPEPRDALELAAIMEDLGLSGDDVRQDRERLRQYAEFRQLHAERAERCARVARAREERDAFEKETRERFQELSRAVITADDASGRADGAAYEADRLRRQRPQLFDGTEPDGFPRLLAPMANVPTVTDPAGPASPPPREEEEDDDDSEPRAPALPAQAKQATKRGGKR